MAGCASLSRPAVLRGEKSVQEAVSAAAPQVNTILQRK
jgi:hypothetical protein